MIGVFFTLRASDFRSLVEARVPVVRIESLKKRGGDLAIDDIYVDSHAAAFGVTEYLIGQGHSCIAMVAGRGGPQATRIKGYRAALFEKDYADHVAIDEGFSESRASTTSRRPSW